MRVNVYGEEITDRIELVEKTVSEGGQGSKLYTFYGIRFWLKFPSQPWWIHRKVDGDMDDDSTAITIWSDDKAKLRIMFERAIGVLDGKHGEYGMHDIIETPVEVEDVDELPEPTPYRPGDSPTGTVL